MSDGPYRTLNMRQQWKQLLKRAYQHAFDRQDVIDAICPALDRDCAWEITNDFMPALRDYCTDKNADLFDDRDARLERLKHLTAGRGTLGAVIADCAQEALLQGKTGQEAIDQALHEALTDRLARSSLQMEEHVLRESGARKASDVRGRWRELWRRHPSLPLCESWEWQPLRRTLRRRSTPALMMELDYNDEGYAEAFACCAGSCA